MVLPWLLVGAAAALEGHRRGAPVSDSRAKVQRLEEVEKDLRKKQKELIQQVQEAASVLKEEKKAHAVDQDKLEDMERIKSDIETRMSRLTDLTDELVTENAQLKVDNALLQDETQRYRAQNEELRSRAEQLSKYNSDLQDKVQLLTEASEEEAARITGQLEDLKAEVSDTLTSFTNGDLQAIEFKDRMDNMGIKLDCSIEQLQALQTNEPAREVLQDAVSTRFESQMGLVLEDKGRLTHLMSIAQNMRLPSSRSDASGSAARAPFESARLTSTTDYSSKQSSLSGGALPLGGGILRALAFNSESSGEKDPDDEGLNAAPSSIPSAALLNASTDPVNGILGQLQELHVGAGSEADKEETPVTRAEPLAKGTAKKPKGLFSLRFKGLPEKRLQNDDLLNGSITSGDDGMGGTHFSSAQIVPK